MTQPEPTVQPDVVVLPIRPGARRERTMATTEYERRLRLLTSQFAADEIERLPKAVSKDQSDKAKCERGTSASADGHYCGGYHARAVHLAYVGHAGITQRLCEVDPHWYLDLLTDERGLPIIQDGLWSGTLHVLDLERVGFGDAQTGLPTKGADGAKIAYGDVLRNAAMRMGVATYLWAKSDRSQALLSAAPEVSPGILDAATEILSRAIQIVETTPQGKVRTNALVSLQREAQKHDLENVEVTLPEWWQTYAEGHMLRPLANALNGANGAPTEAEATAAATRTEES